MGPAGVAGPALAEEGHGPGPQAPPVGRPAVGVRVVPDAHVVGGLLDETERLPSRTRVAVEGQRRWPDEEQSLRGRSHQGREVGEGIGVAEGAVGAVRGEDLDHRVDIVPGHAHGVPGQQLLELDDVGDGWATHDGSSWSSWPVTPRRPTITKFSWLGNDGGGPGGYMGE